MLRKILAAFALCFAVSPAMAITLMSTATGNIGTTATWSVVDTTGTNAFLNSETANTALTTSPVASSTFTPAAETVTSIGVKLASVFAAPSGTITIKLANSTSPGTRECTITINVADLTTTNSPPASATADGGWVILACSASPNGTDAYTITANTSVAAQINLFSLATTNWSRLLVTSGTQANGPAAGDKFYVFGQLTGAGTHNAYAVTIDTTSAVNYGRNDAVFVGSISGTALTVTSVTSGAIAIGQSLYAANSDLTAGTTIVSGSGTSWVVSNSKSVSSETFSANTLVDPAISVGQWGTLQFGSTASTAYVSGFAGPMIVYNGGSYTIGTTGTPIPATGSAVLTMNSTVEGDTGLVVRNGGTFNSFGVANGRTTVKTSLTTTANAAATTMTTAVSTGWLNGDSIAIAGTSAASDTSEAKTLSGNASGTTLTVSALTNQHIGQTMSYTSSSTGVSYSFPMQAEVILLNRNVKIQGNSTTTNGYVYGQANSKLAIAWTEFNQMSGVYGTAQKRGLEVDVGPAGSLSITNSSFHDGHNSCLILGALNPNFGGTQGAYNRLQHNVVYNCAQNSAVSNYAVNILPITVYNTNPYWTVDDLTIFHCANAGFQDIPLLISSQMGNFTNITVANSGAGGSAALSVQYGYSASNVIGGNVGNTWGPLTLHSNTSSQLGLAFNPSTYGIAGTINGLYIWHESPRLYPPAGAGDLTIDPFYLFQTGFGIYQPSASGMRLTVRNGFVAYDNAGGSGNFPLTQDSKTNDVYFDNMDICPIGTFNSVTTVACAGGSGNNGIISLVHDYGPTGGYSSVNSRVWLRNTAILNNLTTQWPSQRGEESFYGPRASILQDCNACTPVKHGAWLPGGYIHYDTTITYSSGYSLRMTPKLLTFSGYIAPNAAGTGTGTLTVTTSTGTNTTPGDALTSNNGSLIPGTFIISGTGPYIVSQSQTVGSAGTPVQFQTYRPGPLLRLQSAPLDMGIKVSVASGAAANVCVWARPSINTDAAPPWGGSAVTYNGDAPRMIARANPYMGIQTDTVMGTSSLTAGAWSQFCANTPTAAADGQFEIVIDADQTFTSNGGGSVNISEWSCTTCGSTNTGQFWWNGSPADFVAPAATGSGNHIIGG